MTIDASAFNFDSMANEIGKNPFAQEANSRQYTVDERFYNLKKDKDGNGAALIRFLPDSEKGMIQRLYSINTTIMKNGKKRFVSEYSPSSIGQPCPFQERWQELWNAGIKKNVLDENGQVVQYGSETFGRGTRFITNIKVLKDPANPENEGKIFLYAMSGKMKDKIQSAVDPSEQDRALGAQPKELFNPLAGNSFRLVARKGANGQINYDNSEVVNEVTSIYDSVDEALTDIKENTHKLSSLLSPESFMTYDELAGRLKWVTFQDTQQVQAAPLQAEAAVAQVQSPEVQPAQEPQVTQVAQVEQTTQVDQVTQATQVAQTGTDSAPQSAPTQSLDELLGSLT
jgi:hypothetical protein